MSFPTEGYTLALGFKKSHQAERLDKLPFVAPPEQIAADILRAAYKKRDIIYTPVIWWPPERIFKKIEIRGRSSVRRAPAHEDASVADQLRRRQA